jgi:hypothetical protein
MRASLGGVRTDSSKNGKLWAEFLPDHELVVTTALVVVGVCGCEDVVGYVGTDVARLVVPLDAGGHALDVANLETLGELLACIGVALDVVLTALPVPGGRPPHARLRGALDCGALAAGGGGSLAPVVVVKLVAVGRVVLVLSAERCGLTAHWRYWCSDWASSGECHQTGEEGGLEQHLGSCLLCLVVWSIVWTVVAMFWSCESVYTYTLFRAV